MDALAAASMSQQRELAVLRARVAELERTLAQFEPGDEAPRALSELRASEERYRRLIEGVRLIAWEYDRARKSFTFISHHAPDILGYPIEDWYAPHFWYDHVHPEDREQAATASRTHVAQGVNHELEYRMIHADGSSVWFKDIATVVKCGNGKITLHGVLIDITERKRAEEALRQSETRFRVLAENSAVGFWQITPEGYTLYINPQMCRILEVDGPHELEGRTYHAYFTPESLELQRVEHARRREGRSSSYEVEVIGKRGTRRNVIISGAPLFRADGQLQSLIGTFIDITDRKKAELEAQRSSEWRRLTLSEMDHRVRNNLASLMALIDISARNQANPRELAAAIRGRVQAMATVHSLLSKSQWSGARLHTLIQSLIPEGLHAAITVAGMDVALAPKQVAALGMVLQELIANSLKYGALSAASGTVAISTSLSSCANESIAARTPSTEPESNRPQLRVELNWHEMGGPAIGTPPVPGVGTSLIEGLVRSELGGNVALSYPPQGACHHFELNVEQAALR